MDKIELGIRISETRKAKGFSQDYVATQLNMIRQTYGAYERGVSIPDALTLSALANLFEVSTDFLLGRQEEKQDKKEKTMREILDEDPDTAQVSTVAAHYDGEITEELKREIARQVKEGIEEYNKRKGRS